MLQGPAAGVAARRGSSRLEPPQSVAGSAQLGEARHSSAELGGARRSSASSAELGGARASSSAARELTVHDASREPQAVASPRLARKRDGVSTGASSARALRRITRGTRDKASSRGTAAPCVPSSSAAAPCLSWRGAGASTAGAAPPRSRRALAPLFARSRLLFGPLLLVLLLQAPDTPASAAAVAAAAPPSRRNSRSRAANRGQRPVPAALRNLSE